LPQYDCLQGLLQDIRGAAAPLVTIVLALSLNWQGELIMVLKLVASSFLLILTAVYSATAPVAPPVSPSVDVVQVAPIVPLQATPVGYFETCHAVCAKSNHPGAWLGDTQYGDDAKKKAQDDADKHNKDFPNHGASVTCP
jgi:hypothetical protein